MSLQFAVSRKDSSTLREVWMLDNPQTFVMYRPYGNPKIAKGDGFAYWFGPTIPIAATSFVLWYRFTPYGMLIGYYANSSNTSISVPNDSYLYIRSFRFNFTDYQLKMYVGAMDFKTYTENNVPMTFDYYSHTDEDCIERVKDLIDVTHIQFKSFKELSVASFACLPYGFYNTYKFDFHHTMYNSDGTLKPEAKIYPVMFSKGGELEPQYFPQPTTIN